MDLPRYESLQPHYNLVERSVYETELEPLCLAEGLGVINYYALAAGFLTGKYRSEADLSKSPRGGGVKKYLNDHGLGVLKALDEVAARLKATPAQVALAWLIARPSVTAPIASATSLEQLQDILKAAALKLTAQDIDDAQRGERVNAPSWRLVAIASAPGAGAWRGRRISNSSSSAGSVVKIIST